MALQIVTEWTRRPAEECSKTLDPIIPTNTCLVVSLWESRSPRAIASFSPDPGEFLIWDCRKMSEPVDRRYESIQNLLPRFCTDHFDLLHRDIRELYV